MCADVYKSDCDFDLLDDACLAAVCGEAVPSHEAQCFDNGEERYHRLDCAYAG